MYHPNYDTHTLKEYVYHVRLEYYDILTHMYHCNRCVLVYHVRLLVVVMLLL